jgi:molecular chaperone DnaK
VLFIGGSADSPLVREAVLRHLPETVLPIVPRDLRSHVSLGAALHSLGFNAFGFDLIQPITSETIYVITKGGNLEPVIPASSEVPSREPFSTTLTVSRRGQQVVELPICVSNENKLMGLVRVQSRRSGGFKEGSPGGRLGPAYPRQTARHLG